MSLIRQIWLLLLCTLLLAFGGSAAIFIGATCDLLEGGLRVKNRDDAAALAQALAQQAGDAIVTVSVIDTWFVGGRYRRVAFTSLAGQGTVQREARPSPRHAPGWFVSLVPIASQPGVAPVMAGRRAVGTVEVVGKTDDAHDELWAGSLQVAAGLALLGIVAGGLAAFQVRAIRRRLLAAVAQAEALERGDYLTLPEPKTLELRHLTRAMNSMVVRLRNVFEAQAAQVETLRRQASADPLTGLSNRRHLMAQLDAALIRQDVTAASGLVLLRVLGLVELNRAIGREAVDRLLLTIAEVLQAYASQVAGAVAGRLNGGDFALVLPEGGVAEQSADALVNVLRARLPIFHPRGAVVAGAVEVRRGARVAELLADADMALARAESEGPFSVMSAGAPGNEAWAGIGERGWHQRVRQALDAGRVQLGRHPLVDATGALVHLESPLRLQLAPGGPFETAASWLPFAARSRLNSAIDERGLELALAASAADGSPRSIDIAPASLLDSGFAARLRSRLQAAPAAARLMWLELAEPADDEQFELMRELARQVRPTGARFGIEHAGARHGRLDRLFEAGVDYVKLDAAISRGVAADPDRGLFADGVVAMLHGLSLRVFGEGVVDDADATRLWASGIDGLTGPWVSEQGSATEPAHAPNSTAAEDAPS